MRNKKFNYRQGKKAVIARLDFHDWVGELVGRTRGNITDKKIGISMISQLLDRFDITISDLKEAVERELIEEAEEQRNIAPVKWTRDERGNIVSPFDRKLKRI